MKKYYLTNEGIKNEMIDCNYFMNISTLTRSSLSKIISSKVKNLQQVKVIKLNGDAHYNKMLKRIIKSNKTKKVIAFVDEDDENQDIKLRNISTMNKYKIIAKVVVKKYDSNHKKNKRGEIVRLCSQHHTSVVAKEMSCVQSIEKIKQNVSAVKLIVTNDDRAGSVAGVIYDLNEKGIPFSIEKQIVKYDECWMTSRKLVNRWKVGVEMQINKDESPINDNNWRFKTGYGYCIETNNNVLPMVLKGKESKNQGKDTDNAYQKSNWLFEMMNTIYTMIEAFVKYIISMFTTTKEKPVQEVYIPFKKQKTDRIKKSTTNKSKSTKKTKTKNVV